MRLGSTKPDARNYNHFAMIECQWLAVPIAGRGQIAIAGRSYDLELAWLGPGGEIPEATVSYPTREGRHRYRLQHDEKLGLWRCECPAQLYRPWELCKHSSAIAELVRQLVERYKG